MHLSGVVGSEAAHRRAMTTGRKPAGGRPKGIDRPIRCSLLLSEIEKAMFRQLAERRGLSLSDCLRQMIRDEFEKRTKKGQGDHG
jgi:hypothetical protein